MRRVFLIATSLMALVTACSRTGNYEQAYFAEKDGKYLVEMKGTRRLMAHDPISAVKGGTYEDHLTIELPRIEGVIEGSEIPVSPDKLRDAVRVVIAKGKIKVDLYYDDSTKHPLPWNGEYTLVPKDTTATP